jgi:hypothetical protein
MEIMRTSGYDLISVLKPLERFLISAWEIFIEWCRALPLAIHIESLSKACRTQGHTYP